MKSHHYVAVCYKSKWSFWNGNKFATQQNEAKEYETKEVADKVKASLQKQNPGLDLVVKEVVA